MALTAASGGVGGIAAAVGAMGAGTYGTEYVSTLSDRVQQAAQGNSLQAVLDNRDLMAEISREAHTRGLVIGGTEALTLGLTGVAAKALRPLYAVPTGLAAQTAGGAGGEAGAQLAAHGEIKDTASIAAEAVLGPVMGAPEVAGSLIAYGKSKLRQRQEADVANLQGAEEAVRQSKLRERDSETFYQTLQEIAKGGDHRHLYIDANALREYLPAFLEAAPQYAREAQDALATGGAVQIAMEDWLFHIAPDTALPDALREHIRFEADGMSLAEIEKHAQSELAGDMERGVTRDRDAEAALREQADIEADMLSRLNAAGMTTHDANTQYAKITAAIFGALGSRTQSAKALYERLAPVISGRVMGEGFGQALAEHPPRGWRHGQTGDDARALWHEPESGHNNKAVFWTDIESPITQVLPQMAGYSHSISTDALRHIKEQHGQGNEELRGQLPVTEEDIARIPEIVSSYDGVRTDFTSEQGARRVAYVKRVHDGVIFYMEEASRKKKDMRGISMRKYPPTIDTDRVLEIATNPNLYVQNGEAAYGNDTTLYQQAAEYSEGAMENSNIPPEEVQFAQTAEAYGSEAAYEAAREAGQTELTYRQWVQVRTPAFKAWFGDWENDPDNASKVVNEKTGEPLVVYHGTSASFEIFKNDRNIHFFSADHNFASNFTLDDNKQPIDGAHVMPLFVSLKNPFDYENKKQVKQIAIRAGLGRASVNEIKKGNWQKIEDRTVVSTIRALAFDGLYVKENGIKNLAVFNPNQIKSATDNSGAYSAQTDNIYYQTRQHTHLAEQAAPIRSAESFEAVRRVLSAIVGKPLANRETGMTATISRKTINKMLSGKAHNKSSSLRAHLLAAANVDRLFENAVLGWTVPDKNNDTNIVGIHRMFAPLDVDGEVQLAKLTVKEYSNNQGGRIYSVEAIEIGNKNNPVPEMTDADSKVGLTSHRLHGANVDSLVQQIQDYNRNFRNGLLQHPQSPHGFFNPATNTITLTENADLSTFIHELGHFFLESMVGFSNELRHIDALQGGGTLTDGERGVVRDVDTLMDWFGLDLTTWNRMSLKEKRPYHEQFARGFEQFLLEGKAPSLALQGIFARFRAWLLSIYKRADSLGVPLTDEVRQVFGRMLASDEAITLAEQNRSMQAMFATAEEAGMTEEQFAEYQRLGQEAHDAAMDEMQGRSVRDLKYIRTLKSRKLLELQREAREMRAQVEMEARREK